MNFFRALHSDVEMIISPVSDAIQTNPATGDPLQIGSFSFTRFGSTASPLVVYYSINGTAISGVDYTGVNSNTLTGSIVLAAGIGSMNIDILPIPWRTYLNPLTVTLTILPTNTYLVDLPASATITISEHLFGPVAFLNNPVGLDYHARSNSLIASFNFNDGNPNAFAQIYTNIVSSNSVVVTNWSDVASLSDEVKLATVKETRNGFTNGDMYFSSGLDIGKLSADGATANLNWSVLTNEDVSTAIGVRGGLYVDQTGTWSNQLIVAAGDDSYQLDHKIIWRVDAQGHPNFVTNILTSHLEGVITLTNDVAKWGPWAGKIITGDEGAVPQPLIYTISTNGTVSYFASDIHPEDFDIIPPNQNLYACDESFLGGAIMKLPASFFTNNVGDLLITDAGENVPPAKLFIVHWDGTNFVVKGISYIHPDGSPGSFEHVTFAPIDLPYLSQ